MKELYKSPVITVEELTEKDVLCASATRGPSNPNDPNFANKRFENYAQGGLEIGL